MARSTNNQKHRLMRRIALILTCIFCIVSTYAIEPRLVQKFEFEARGGFTIPLGGYHGGNQYGSMTLGLELRYNTEELPWDCGVFLQLDGASRHYDIPERPDGYRLQTNRTLAYGITGDYNFRQGYRVNPFVGIGIGCGSYDQVGNSLYQNVTPATTFVFMPRAGVELFHHLRLTAHCMIVRRGFHTAAIAIGVVIGGRPKKTD